MEEMKESMQLREFELEEKLNHLEDTVEWANEDKGNLKAELEETIKELKKYVILWFHFFFNYMRRNVNQLNVGSRISYV